jgi:hypothetical protein
MMTYAKNGAHPHVVDQSGLLSADPKRLGRPVTLWKMLADAPMRPELDKFVAGLGLDPATRALPCIALHVRHGDACFSGYKINDVLERTCFPLKTFVGEVRRLIQKYGPHSVFLATDDPKIAVQTAEFPDIDWRFQKIDRTKYDTLTVTDDNPQRATASAASEAWKDLWAMGQCDMAVGSMVSTLLQLAMELQIARKGHFVPFVSLETSWGDPFLWNTWYRFQKGEPDWGKNACTCKKTKPPASWPRYCKCDRKNGYK